MSILPQEGQPFCTMNVGGILLRVIIKNGAGRDNIPGHVLEICQHQVADVITDIFNISLSQVSPPASR